jgi:hypothetical protein
MAFTVIGSNAYFKIKVPEINRLAVEKTKQSAKSAGEMSEKQFLINASNRQMVMDDAYTFFDAEPVEEYDSAARLQKDIGWYLKSNLRILGTFPERSAFRIAVRKNGKELSGVRCEGQIYTKANDINLRTEIKRRGRDLSYDDFMTTDLRCFDKEAVNKAIGKMDVEVYFIDGDTDEEKLVRTYKIDVHKATKVRGSASKPQPDVSDYYIQRHAETAVAVAYFMQSNVNGTYFTKAVDNYGTKSYRTLYIYTTYSPADKYISTTGSFARCTVNGQRIDFSNNLNKDKVGINEDQSRREIGIYTDRFAPKYKRGSAYKDQVEFTGLTFRMPIYTGEDNSSLDLVKIEDNPGTWECKISAKGETYRTFRWEVANGKIVPHAEQQSGNTNLFYDAAIVDMEIPPGGSPIDFRLMPMPEKGFFYGIPWTTPEGKKMAAGVPKVGNPFHIPSNKAK